MSISNSVLKYENFFVLNDIYCDGLGKFNVHDTVDKVKKDNVITVNGKLLNYERFDEENDARYKIVGNVGSFGYLENIEIKIDFNDEVVCFDFYKLYEGGVVEKFEYKSYINNVTSSMDIMNVKKFDITTKGFLIKGIIEET